MRTHLAQNAFGTARHYKHDTYLWRTDVREATYGNALHLIVHTQTRCEVECTDGTQWLCNAGIAAI